MENNLGKSPTTKETEEYKAAILEIQDLQTKFSNASEEFERLLEDLLNGKTKPADAKIKAHRIWQDATGNV